MIFKKSEENGWGILLGSTPSCEDCPHTTLSCHAPRTAFTQSSSARGLPTDPVRRSARILSSAKFRPVVRISHGIRFQESWPRVMTQGPFAGEVPKNKADLSLALEVSGFHHQGKMESALEWKPLKRARWRILIPGSQ